MIRLNASRIFHIIGSPSASVRLAALLLFMTLAPAAALAQTPAPTQGTNPVAERGLTLPAGALQPSARPGSQTGNADKPELVLQTGYQFLGATGVVFSPDNRLLATITLNSNAVKLWETATGRELRTLASSASAGAGAGYLSILTGVSAVAFSADSRLLAAGGRDNSLTLWDVTNGRELRTFDAQAAAVTNNLAALAGTGVTALAFTPDGQRLISMGDALRVWDVATGRALQTLAADISVPTGLGGTQLAISPDGSQVALFRTALNNNEKTIAIIDLNTGREARSFKLPDDLYGNSAVLAFTSGGQVFAADVDQSRLKFWNVTAKEKPRTLAEFSGSFDYQTAFSPDGRLLALAAGGALKIWDTSSGRELNAIAVIPPAPANTGTIQDAITSFAFSRDGRQLAVSARRQLTTQLALWDTNSSQLIREMSTGKTNYAYQVAFSADGTRLVSGGKTIWDLTTGRGLRAFVPTATDPFGSLSRDGRLLATSNFNDNRITLYDVATQRKLSTLAPAEQANTSEIVVFSPDGKLLASAYRLSQEQLQQRQHPTLKRESPNSGDLSKMQKEAMKEAMKAAQKDPLAAMRIMQEKMMQQSAPQSAPQAGIESQVKLWNTATGQPAGSLSLPSGNPFIPGYVGHVLFSPDSRTLAVTSQTGPGVTLWDVATGRQLASIGQPPTAAANANPFGMIANPLSGGGVTALAFSSDGRLLATGGKDLKSNFDLSSMMSAAMAAASGRGGQSKGQTPTPPNVADLMQNIKPTVSGSLKIYDAASGQELRAFPGLANEIKAVAFSRDALTLAAAASDNAIKLYDLTSGRERLTLRGHTAQINSVAFNPNGQILASASHDGSTLLWDARTGEQLATLISLGKDGSDWLVVTPDGLFDGSPAAWNQILWRYDRDTFNVAPIEWFFNEFFYPDLLADLMSGRRPRAPRDFAQLDRHPPKLVLTLVSPAAPIANPSAPANAEASTPVTTREITVKIDIKEAPTGARDLRLFRNGSLVKVWRGDVLNGPATQTLEATLPIIAGENRLTAYAFNRDNVKSADATLRVQGAENLRRKGTAYVLAIGVNAYANSQYDLRYAVADARSFGDELQRQQTQLGFYERTEIIALYDKDATKAKVLTALETLAAKTQPEDLFAVYFAGHGTAQRNQFFLLPHDLGYAGDRTRLDAKGLQVILSHSISDTELETAFERVGAGQLLFVIDACNSGQALEAEEKRRGPMNSKGLAQLAYEKGMFILTASQSYQAAQEASQLGHGLLTYALVEEGLKQAAADGEPKDGTVLAREWFDYAMERVPTIQIEKLKQARSAGLDLSFVESEQPPQQRGLDTMRRITQRPRVFYRRELETRSIIIAKTK